MSAIDVLREALREIAEMPTVQINPDGDDQAAWTMQLVAREALEAAPVEYEWRGVTTAAGGSPIPWATCSSREIAEDEIEPRHSYGPTWIERRVKVDPGPWERVS